VQNLISRYRSESETADAYYASINYVRDSFGDEGTRGDGGVLQPRTRLKVGQVVTFECSATDPYDRDITWRFALVGQSDVVPIIQLGEIRGATTTFEWTVDSQHFGEGRLLRIAMSNDSPYKRDAEADDMVSFHYDVSPPVPPRVTAAAVAEQRAEAERWRQFARSHAIGEIVPGEIMKLVPFGAAVRVEDGIEALVHISDQSERHVEVADQMVAVGDDAMVKIIDIDREKRRISLSLKQANEDYSDEFDPAKYGMADSYDEGGNYIFPDGFDPETNEWLEGCEAQRTEWEARYTEAERRHKMHTAQMEKFAAGEAQ
jgi:predicted RNA-binding protein with RPS1 domain